MFALWYGTLVYKEYRDIIWSKLLPKKQSTTPTPKETAIVCPLPPKKAEPSRIPVIEPSKSRSPSPQPPRTISTPPSTVPPSPFSPTSHSTPVKENLPTDPPRSLEAPPKPPRSPSPHPIRAEAFEEMEYDEVDDDEEEEERESSDVEEDDENSVISSSPRRAPVANSVNEFLNQEISSQGVNQPR